MLKDALDFVFGEDYGEALGLIGADGMGINREVAF